MKTPIYLEIAIVAFAAAFFCLVTLGLTFGDEKLGLAALSVLTAASVLAIYYAIELQTQNQQPNIHT